MDTKNLVVLTGRLVADPELRITPKGDPVANFGLAVNRSIRKDDGSWEDQLDGFFDCEHFGDTAEKLAAELKKGTLVQIVGSLHQRKFKVGNGAGNRTVSKIEVRARSVAPVLVAPKAAPAEQPVQQAVPQPA